jgi:hypothetical protein
MYIVYNVYMYSLYYSTLFWLILPVVICLSQRLSHACLSTHEYKSETAKGSLYQLWFLRLLAVTWITVVILELIHAIINTDLMERVLLLG